MNISKHPVWLAGFRPLFILVIFSAVIFPPLWALYFNGMLTMTFPTYSAIQWHAHEMFFGFGWALLGGFLLTSTKNWVHIRGYHGNSLIFLTIAWIFERVGISWGGTWPPMLFLISNNLYLVSIVLMLITSLIKYRKKDSNARENLYFIFILPVFIISKYLLLSLNYFQLGTSMTIGLFRMAFLIMLERTVTQFMKGAFQVNILRHPALDNLIKVLGLLLIFEYLLPTNLSAGLFLLLALLLIYRFIFWKASLAFQRMDIGIMYTGYLFIIIQLLSGANDKFFHPQWTGTVTTHLFTLGVMGLIIPAMMVRISNGHTGRKIVFQIKDKVVLWIMLLALVLRVALPQFYPSGYLSLLLATSLCWFLGFSILGWNYIPFLLRPRIDGKEH